MKLQLVIPAYNEEARLPRTLVELRRHVVRERAHLGQVEVIVVDNDSTDATAQVAQAADSSALPVRVVSCARRGKGAAVKAGIAATDAPVVGFMDADGATGLEALEVARHRLLAGAHVVIGSRAAPGASAEVRHSRVREAGARAYRSMTARVVPGVADTQCGFKMMDGELGREVFRGVRAPGFSFDVEFLAVARSLGARIDELPVTWTDVPGSTFVPVRHGLSSFGELAAIAWRQRARRAHPVVWVAPSTPRPSAPVLPAVLPAVRGQDPRSTHLGLVSEA